MMTDISAAPVGGSVGEPVTVEYAVQCVDGSIDPEVDHDATSLDGACDEAGYLDSPTVNRPAPKFCGPHTVVQRQVGPWVPVS